MDKTVDMDGVYVVSETVVAREIEGELIIVPVTAGTADLEEALFSLNETGRAVWDRLDGSATLNAVCDRLADLYDGDPGEMARDVAGLVGAMLQRGLVVKSGDA